MIQHFRSQAMGEHSVEMRIIQVTDPWKFLALEIPETAKSPDALEFYKMKEDMNQYFDQMMEQGTIPHKPVLNEICAAQKRGENTWHRVRVESMSTQNRGHQAICYLIDEGSEITVSTRRLMKLPKKFREFPVQVHQCCLWGIQPLSLKVEEGDMGLDAKHRPSYKWDPSAVQYMRKMMEESKGCQAEIVAKDADDIYYVRLYFMTRKGLVCFNEKLVQEEYAVNVETPELNANLQYDGMPGLQKDVSSKEASPKAVTVNDHSCPELSDMPPLVHVSSAHDEGKHTNYAQMETKQPRNHHRQVETDSPLSPTESELAPSVQAFFQKAKEILSSPETISSPESRISHSKSPLFSESNKRSNRHFINSSKSGSDLSGSGSKSHSANSQNISSPDSSGLTSRSSLSKGNMRSQGYESPKKMGSTKSFAPDEKGDAPPVAKLFSERQQSSEYKISKLGSLQNNTPTDLQDKLKTISLSRGRGFLSPTKSSDSGDVQKPGGLLLQKKSPPSSLPSQPSSKKLSPQIERQPPQTERKPVQSQNSRGSDRPFKFQSSDVTDPNTWGEGARPKGSVLKSHPPLMRDSSCPPLLAKGSGSANSRITHDMSSPHLLQNESESDVKSPDKVLQHIPTQTERSPKMNNVEQPRKMKSSQSDNESVSSADSGVRARYRKSIDPTITVKKLEEDKLAQIRLSKDKFLQEREENRFLDLLRMRSGKMPQRNEDPVPMLNRQDLPIARPLFGVVVHGKSIPSITVDVTEVPFHENVLKVLEKQFQIETAVGVQAFVWSAVLNCRHVIGVCPPGKGKTISYLPGLISQLGDPTTYMELPQGKGPLALILVPSWKKARDVFGKVEYFQKSGPHGMNQIRSIVLYAGGAEDNENTQMALLQGCEILIATPPSLCRMLDQDFTSLKRLCHIVFDDAEIVSTRFFDEVYAIMQQYKLVLRDRRKQNVPRQIMIFSTQWHDGIEKFRLMYTKEPVIAISSRVEAAVYGNVKQVVITSKWEQRLSKFCGLLDSLATSSQRVASFTSDMSEALEMYQAAKSRGVYCLLIHEESTLETVTEVRNQWLDSSHSKQLIVIVSTDDCYQDLAITNATMVIHYGLPNSKTKFGNRLACMLDYFVDRTAERQADVEPVSHVILTDRCADRAQSLFEILQRCKAEYSPQLNEFLRGYQSGLDSDENRDFCPFLKSFGTCINRDKCEYRHVLIPHRDLKTGEISQNTLPYSGEIKIKVLEVVNASGYYCHLVEHRSATDNSRTDLRLVYQRLALDMVTFFSKESNQVPYVPSDNPREDGLCAFKDENDVYYRAQVLEVKEGTRAEPMKQCKVWLVDAGCYRYGTIDQLVKLSRRLAEVPYQAVEVYLCSLKPMDDDSEWTDKANMFVDELIRGKELVGRIMLRVGLTLWLMPLVHQRKLRGVGLVSDFNVRQELLANKYATVHTDHIQQLYELFRGKTDIPEKIMRQYYDYCLEVEMTQETLSSKEECHAVCIAAVIKPDLFYIHKWDKYEGLEQLEVKIAEWMVEENNNGRDHKLDTDAKLENGSVCLALSSDGKWYRAKIVSDQTDGQWEVFFLDYGDRENVSDDMIRPLPRHLGELPCQVIECQLAYIKPKGDDWPVIAVGTMCDLSHFVNEDKKMLYAKVVDKTDASYTIGQRLVVDVHDTTDGDKRFSEELVRRHVAVCADSSAGITDLVEKPALKNQKFFNSLDRIPYLCANIYWCEDHEDALQQANELRQLMSIRIRGWDVALEQRGVLSSVVKVIGYIPNAEAHCILLDCLVSCCLKSARLCDITIKENLAANLVRCLQQTSRPVIQHQAAQALSHLVELDSFCDAVHASSSVTSTLEQFLSWNEKTPVDLEVLKCICSTAAKLVRTSDESCCEELKSAEMMEQIYHYLVQTTKDAEREPWLELLAAIATWESTHSYMMREAHVAVIKDLLTKCQCVKCLYYSLSVCRSLVLGSRKHKRMLLESKLLIDLKDLLNRDLKSPALEMCRELQAEMNLQLPQHEAMAGVPARQDHGTVRMTCPNVTWRQNCFRVILTVKVRNAKEDDFHITTTSVSCRSESEGVGYEFDWDLYDSILPDQSKITCHASETLIDLRKGAKGQWSRLLKQKCKVPNLSLNFDHPYDSDEEDVEDADDMSKLTQPKDLFRQEEILRVKRVGPYSSDEGSESDSFGSSENGEDPVADFD